MKETLMEYETESKKDLKEAIEILGLDQAPLKFCDDYDWMIDTTKEIIKRYGMSYLRKDVKKLMKNWEIFATK